MIPLPDPQAVIERGRHARDLLEHASFTAIVDELTSLHLSALVAAPPGPRAQEARDYHHTQQHALTELVAALRGYADAGAAMERALDEGDDEDTL